MTQVSPADQRRNRSIDPVRIIALSASLAIQAGLAIALVEVDSPRGQDVRLRLNRAALRLACGCGIPYPPAQHTRHAEPYFGR